MPAAVDLEGLSNGDAVQDHLISLTGSRSVPKVYIGGDLIGGCDDTMALFSKKTLEPMMQAAIDSSAEAPKA